MSKPSMKMTKRELLEALKNIQSEKQRKDRKTIMYIVAIIALTSMLVMMFSSCQIETKSTETEKVDMEVGALREKLNPCGISVFRIDPNNPEHQRRYQRHLVGNISLGR